MFILESSLENLLFGGSMSIKGMVNGILAGGWATPPQNMTSSVGMMKFPIYGKIKHVPNHQPEYLCPIYI